MADARSPLVPADASPSVAEAVRRIAPALQGRGGVAFGPSWRAVEQAYPTTRDQVCLVFQFNGKTVFVVRPDGTFQGVQ